MRKLQFRSYRNYAIVLRGIEEIINEVIDDRINKSTGVKHYKHVLTHFVVDIEIIARTSRRTNLDHLLTDDEIQILRQQIRAGSGFCSVFTKKDLAALKTVLCEADDLWFEKEGIKYTYTNNVTKKHFTTIIPVLKNTLKEYLLCNEIFKEHYNDHEYDMSGYYSFILDYLALPHTKKDSGNFLNVVDTIVNHRNVISFRDNIESASLDELTAKKADNSRRILIDEWQKSYSVIMEQVKLMPVEQQTEYFKMLESLNSAAMARISM